MYLGVENGNVPGDGTFGDATGPLLTRLGGGLMAPSPAGIPSSTLPALCMVALGALKEVNEPALCPDGWDMLTVKSERGVTGPARGDALSSACEVKDPALGPCGDRGLGPMLLFKPRTGVPACLLLPTNAGCPMLTAGTPVPIVRLI